MFLSIYNNHSGEEFIRRLAPNESLDLKTHILKWAESEFDGMAVPSFSETGKHIPNGCGEYQGEIRHTKLSGGSCWASEPFFMEWNE